MKNTLPLIFATLLISLLNASIELYAQEALSCVGEAPVCGLFDTGVRCITTPCPSSEEVTFKNICDLKENDATLLYEGVCKEEGSPEILPVTETRPPQDTPVTDLEIEDIINQIDEVEKKIEALNSEIEGKIETTSWINRTWNSLIDLIIFWN